MITLRKQLQQAVTREHYEEAAQLRDQIRRLEEG
jgi:protein-arginine kinase activator protein McsA